MSSLCLYLSENNNICKYTPYEYNIYLIVFHKAQEIKRTFFPYKQITLSYLQYTLWIDNQNFEETDVLTFKRTNQSYKQQKEENYSYHSLCSFPKSFPFHSFSLLESRPVTMVNISTYRMIYVNERNLLDNFL